MTGKSAFFDVRTIKKILASSSVCRRGEEAPLSQKFKVDSRMVEPGDVFVARRGDREDGHDYIKDAVTSGASAVLLEEAYYEKHERELNTLGVTLIAVRNSEKALVTLASAWLKEVSPSVVGITGSVGKTTTREFLAACLQKKRRVHAAEKSYNTLVGCSLTVLAMPKNTEVLVLELGTNHPGEIRAMVSYFPVTHGVITEVAPAHLEGLKSLEGVLSAKMEIASSERLLFLSYNSDNINLSGAIALLPERIKTCGVGNTGAGTRISDVKQRISIGGETELLFVLTHEDRKFPCRSKIFGEQHVRNFGYAFVIANELGIDPQSILSSFENVDLMPGRGRIRPGQNGCIVIDETYNANPASLLGALKNLQEIRGADGSDTYRKVAVIGGMRELGAASDYWHRTVLEMTGQLDGLYLIGEEWSGTQPSGGAFRGIWKDADDFLNELKPESFRRSIVMLKGSRYYALERILSALLGDRHAD